MSAFWEKYKDPRWQRRRLQVMEAAGFICQHCKSSESTLNVHHKSYRKGADPWEYADAELMCLCEDCHEQWHKAKDNFAIALQYMGLDEFREVVGYAIGIALRTCDPDCTVWFRHTSGNLGISKALGITPAQIEKLRRGDGAVFAGEIRSLIKPPRGKK